MKKRCAPYNRYSDEIIDKIYNYIDNYQSLGDVIPSIEGLCAHLKIAKTTIFGWNREADKVDFSKALQELRDTQVRVLINRSLSGDFNPSISKMLLSTHGYIEKKQVDNTSSDGSMTPKITVIERKIIDTKHDNS